MSTKKCAPPCHRQIALVFCLSWLVGCDVDERKLYPGETSTTIDWTDAGNAGNGGSSGNAGTCEAGGGNNCAPGGGGGTASASTRKPGSGGVNSTDSTSPVAGAGGATEPSVADVTACDDRNENGTNDSAESLADNGAFNSNSTFWDPETGVGVVWNDKDACGSAKSGSLAITFTKSGSATGAEAGAAIQCVAASAGKNYSLSALLYLSASGSHSGVGLSFFSTTDCSGTKLGGNDSPLQMVAGAWNESTTNSVAPPKTQTVLLRLLVGRSDWSSTQASASAKVDSVLLLQIN